MGGPCIDPRGRHERPSAKAMVLIARAVMRSKQLLSREDDDLPAGTAIPGFGRPWANPWFRDFSRWAREPLAGYSFPLCTCKQKQAKPDREPTLTRAVHRPSRASRAAICESDGLDSARRYALEAVAITRRRRPPGRHCHSRVRSPLGKPLVPRLFAMG